MPRPAPAVRGRHSIWIYELSGASALRRLTFGDRNRVPAWSADGQRVAFQSDRDGDLAIFWQRADGGGFADRLTTPAEGASAVDRGIPTSSRFTTRLQIRCASPPAMGISRATMAAAHGARPAPVSTSATCAAWQSIPDNRRSSWYPPRPAATQRI